MKPLSRLAVVLLLSLAGCVQVEQTLKLHGDGSGTMHLHYAASLEGVRAMEEVARRAALVEEEIETPLNFDEKGIREDFEAYRPLGVTLNDVSMADVDGWRHVNLDIAFTSLVALARTEFISDRSLTLRRTENGSYELRQAAESQLDIGPALDASGPEAETMLRDMLQGFRATVRMEVPGPVTETNGRQDGERAAEWEFTVDDDPESLKKLQRFDLRVVFAAGDLALPELRPPAGGEGAGDDTP